MSFFTAAGTPNTLYPELVQHCMSAGSRVPSRVSMTRELHPAVLRVERPGERLITSYGRPINVAFALAEVLWILSGRRDVEMLSFYNKQVASYSDDGVNFNAAYGYRVRNAHGFDQLEDVIRTLKHDPDSRQATLSIWHPADRGWDEVYDPSQMSVDALQSGASAELVLHTTKDRACNLLSHLLIRDDALDWTQVLRSNDAIWGVPYNWMQWMHLQEYVAARVGVPVGNYYHVADSLHIYDYHWEEAAQVSHFDLYQQYEDHVPMGEFSLSDLEAAEEQIRAGGTIECVSSDYWCSALMVLAAHREFKLGQDQAAMELLFECPDRVLGAAQFRFYWGLRWHKGYSVPHFTPQVDSWIKGEKWQP